MRTGDSAPVAKTLSGANQFWLGLTRTSEEMAGVSLTACRLAHSEGKGAPSGRFPGCLASDCSLARDLALPGGSRGRKEESWSQPSGMTRLPQNSQVEALFVEALLETGGQQ